MISSVASGAAKSQFAPPAAAAQRGAQYRSNAAAAVVECVSASAAAAAYAEASDHSQPVAAEPGGVSASLHTASAFATPVICTHQLHALRTPAEHASAGMRCTGMCVHVQNACVPRRAGGHVLSCVPLQVTRPENAEWEAGGSAWLEGHARTAACGRDDQWS